MLIEQGHFAAQADDVGRHGQIAIQHAQQGGLATAVGADQAHTLAHAQPQVQGFAVAMRQTQLLQSQYFPPRVTLRGRCMQDDGTALFNFTGCITDLNVQGL
ncbi:hypothetical protein D3C80_1865360 [compost metagenome]